MSKSDCFHRPSAASNPNDRAAGESRRHVLLSERFDPRQMAILLDVDGTILDIAPQWDAVEVPESLIPILDKIHDQVGGALALVSGRTLRNLDELFAPLLLPTIGGHGAEIRPARNGRAVSRPTIALDVGIRQDLQEIAARYPGVIVEDKGYSLVLHYRQAFECGLDLASDVLRAARNFPAGSFELLTAKAAVEVKSSGFNKGSAVRDLMNYPAFAGRKPIFIGDDVTDKAAFAVMPEFRGLAVSVGNMMPGALDVFRTPGDVRCWLENFSNSASRSA